MIGDTTLRVLYVARRHPCVCVVLCVAMLFGGAFAASARVSDALVGTPACGITMLLGETFACKCAILVDKYGAACCSSIAHRDAAPARASAGASACGVTTLLGGPFARKCMISSAEV